MSPPGLGRPPAAGLDDGPLPGPKRGLNGPKRRLARIGLSIPLPSSACRSILPREYPGQRPSADDAAVFSLYAFRMTQEALVPRPAAGPPGGLLADAAIAAVLGVFMLVGTYFASRYHAGARPFDAGAAG